METNKISVITCTLNSQKFLKDCLDSVQKQTYKNYEHVFVDGFSTDNTRQMIDDYSNQNRGVNVKVTEAKPMGIANAMNVGINNSQGDIINFLHGDDFYYSKNSLARVADLFEKHPDKSWIIGNFTKMVGKKIFIFPVNNLFTLKQNFPYKIPNLVQQGNVFMKRRLHDKYGLFDEKYKIVMDLDFWLRIEKEDAPLVVSETFTVFRAHRDSTSSKLINKPAVVKEMFMTVKESLAEK